MQQRNDTTSTSSLHIQQQNDTTSTSSLHIQQQNDTASTFISETTPPPLLPSTFLFTFLTSPCTYPILPSRKPKIYVPPTSHSPKKVLFRSSISFITWSPLTDSNVRVFPFRLFLFTRVSNQLSTIIYNQMQYLSNCCCRELS